MNHKPLFLTVTLIALLAIAGVFWYRQQRQVSVKTPSVAEPVTQMPVQTEPVTDPSQYPQHIEAIPGNTDEVWYNIPELGIRMKLNKEFAEDLVYSVSSIKQTYAENEVYDVAYFSTRSMMNIDTFCAPEKGSPDGAVSRNRGIARDVTKDNDYIISRLDTIIQIGNFYYMYSKPQATCWDPSLTPEILKLGTNRYQGKGVMSLDEGFKNIKIIPEKS